MWIFITLPRPCATSSPPGCSSLRKPDCWGPLLQLQQGRAAGWGGSFPSTAHQCLGIQRRKQDAFENVSSVVSCTDGFPSLPSLCCCAVLQLKLQQRRTREELVSQGIMPRKYHFSSLPWSFYACFLVENGFPYDLKDQVLCFCMANIICKSPTLSHPAWSF